MLRLFLGLELPEHIRDQLSDLYEGWPDARWVPDENFHLTIRFLGEMDEALVEEMDAGLQTLVSPPFELALSGIDYFTKGERLTALWAGVQDASTLKALHAKVETNLRQSGIAPESRKFTPHVTLARFRAGDMHRMGTYLERHNTFQTEPFWVENLSLFRSYVTHEGSDYEVVERYPLRLN